MRFSQSNYEIASLEVDRARAGHLPTLDLVASANAHTNSGSTAATSAATRAPALLGVVAQRADLHRRLREFARARDDLAAGPRARRPRSRPSAVAATNAQDGFSGVNSAAAGVKAFEQAVASAEVALQSNILGQEVGIRTNLDVLNVQQNVYSTRRDLANAYFQYMIAVLRLKSAVGNLTEQDLEDLNRAVERVEHARQAPSARARPTADRSRRRARRGMRARRRASASRRAGSREQRADFRDQRVAHRRRAARRCAATACAAASAKLNVCGPISVGVPTAIGSIRFCPPSGSRLPPTNATSAAA